MILDARRQGASPSRKEPSDVSHDTGPDTLSLVRR